MTSFFGEYWYLRRNLDVAEAVARGQFANGLEHFARYGLEEARYPSLFFTPSYYLEANPDVVEAISSANFNSAWEHYAAYGQQEVRRYSYVYGSQEVAGSLIVTVGKIFDADYYMSRYQDVASAVASATFSSALDHYLQFGSIEERAPSLIFDPIEYFIQNADVASAKAAGTYANALHHLLLHGQNEVRQTSQYFNGSYYLQTHPDVAAEQIAPLQHFLAYGAEEARQPASNVTVTNGEDGALFSNGQLTIHLRLDQTTNNPNGHGGAGPVNIAPVAVDAVIAIDENSANGTVVGTVSATDANASDILTYAITAGNGLGGFAINAATGQITVADVTQLDFETNPTFTLTVTVTDDGTGLLTDTATITINLNDVAEGVTVGTEIPDMAATADGAVAFSYDTSTHFGSGVGAVTYAITSLVYGTGDPSSWVAADWTAAGLAIDVNTGVITGTPDVNDRGVVSITVTATDAAMNAVSESFELYLHDGTLTLGTAGADNVATTGGSDEVFAGSGADTIVAQAGADSVHGGDGSDSVEGDNSNDTLYGGEGGDTLDGGNADDLLYGGDGDDLLEGSTGIDTIYGGSGADTIDAGEGGATNTDLVYGGVGDDTVYLGTGNDTAYGEAGADSINGSRGDDLLYGGVGSDTLLGGDIESDTLDGGADADTLTGGSGADTFLFSSLIHSVDGASDLITDWADGTNKIDLSALGISGIGVGAMHITITNDGSYTYVDHNSSTFRVTLAGVHALVAGDFVFAQALYATNLTHTESWTEDVALNLVSDIVVGSDQANVTATLTLSAAAAGALSTATSGAVTSSYNAGTGVWTASGALADVNTLLAGVTFTPASNYDLDFTITVAVTDGTNPALNGTITMDGTPVQDAPMVNSAIADKVAYNGSSFNYVVSTSAIVDPDTGDSLTYSATLSDGSPLPGWLTFTAGTRTFSGTPGGGDIGTVTVRVTATDGSAASAFDDFDITVNAAVAFTNVTVAAGVGATGNNWGVAWGDFDNDSDADLSVSTRGGTHILYRNNADGTFTNIAVAAGVNVSIQSYSSNWVDYDQDGYLDLYVSHEGGQDILYHNNGNGTFTNVAAAAGVNYPGFSMSASWSDYDGDGDQDFYIADWLNTHVLYRNNNDGTFTDVSVAAGVDNSNNGNEVKWADFDGDNDLDIYLVNYSSQANKLYRNNGDGTFTNIAAAAGVNSAADGQNSEWGDYDGDGDLDIYVTNNGQANKLYRNNGDNTFTDIAAAAGVNDSSLSSDASWADYDGDGDLDIYVANYGQANKLYRNNGDSTFTDIAATAGVNDANDGSTVTWADYDGDGDLDIYVANYGQANVFYENQLNPDASTYLSVDFTGAAGGMAVRLYNGATHIATRLIEDGGYGSSVTPISFFGLNDSTSYTVSFTMPDGMAYSYGVGTADGAVHKVIIGGAAADTRTGSAVEDLMIGQGGDDTLSGGTGNDRLYGNSGADSIDGGAGADTLTGGTGNDKFVFSNLTHSTNSAADLITDFANGSDSIDLTGLGFTALTDFETLSFAAGVTTLADTQTSFAITFTGDVTGQLDNTDFIW